MRHVNGRQTPTLQEEPGYENGFRERTTSPVHEQDFQYQTKPIKTGRLTAADFEAEGADTVAPHPDLNPQDIHVPPTHRR